MRQLVTIVSKCDRCVREGVREFSLFCRGIKNIAIKRRCRFRHRNVSKPTILVVVGLFEPPPDTCHDSHTRFAYQDSTCVYQVTLPFVPSQLTRTPGSSISPALPRIHTCPNVLPVASFLTSSRRLRFYELIAR